jgi:hypothetical protein
VLLFSFLGAAGLTAWSTIVHQRRPR